MSHESFGRASFASDDDEALPRRGSLAERIEALQAAASPRSSCGTDAGPEAMSVAEAKMPTPPPPLPPPSEPPAERARLSRVPTSQLHQQASGGIADDADDGDDEERPPSVTVEVFKRLCLRCPPRLEDTSTLLRRSLGAQIEIIATFFEDAAVFVLSRLWFDVLSGYLLKLHAVVYCGTYLAMGCVPESTAATQFLFALAIVPLAALFKHLVEWSELTSRPGFNQVPMMLKYTVGWAFAIGVEAQLAEIKRDRPELCAAHDTDDCFRLDLAAAASLTTLSGLVLLVAKPLAFDMATIECGDHWLHDFFEDLLADLWAMVARALSVSVMVLWYDTSYRYVTFGREADPLHPDHRLDKLLVLWAVSITFAGSFAATLLEQLEIELKRRSTKLAAGERDLRVECVVTYSDLLQDSLSWVAGCAWVDVVLVVFSSLQDVPSPIVLMLNFGVSALVAAFAIAWFALTGTGNEGINENRDQIEKYFVTNSLAFFVGWVWLVVHRNAFALVDKALEQALGYVQQPRWYGDYLGSIAYALLATFLIFFMQNHAVEMIASGAGVEYVPKEKRHVQQHIRKLRLASFVAGKGKLRSSAAAKELV